MSIVSLPRAQSTSTESVTDARTLEALLPEWERLWCEARAAPFQSPAWLAPWWKHVGRGQLASIAVRDEDSGELVGFAPLYIFRDDDGVRHLFPLGIATTDRLDALARPGREDEVARAVAQHVLAIADEWDVFEAPQLDRDALLLRCTWPAGWKRVIHPCEAHPVVALPARLPESAAKNLAYCRRRAARAGDVTYEFATPHNLDALLDALFALHTKRWSQRQLPGVLAEPDIRAWHREAAPRLLALGLLRLIALRVDGRVIGAVFLLADRAHVPRRRWHSYIGGFDPASAALGPGTLLIGHAIDAATAEGACAFDFLRGAESYKYRWGAVDEPMFALEVCGVNVRRSPRPA